MAVDKSLQDRLNRIDQIREELSKAEESAAKDIMTLLKDLMQQNPLLEGVRWNQYTPHFNDGDACTFGVNGPEFKFNLGAPVKSDDDEEVESDNYGDYNNDGWYDDWTVNDKFFEKRKDVMNFEQVDALKKTVDDVKTVFSRLCDMEDHLENMFGDGVQIVVTRDGVETEEYDHD